MKKGGLITDRHEHVKYEMDYITGTILPKI